MICAIAEDKVCDCCIVSSWALPIFLLCLWWPNSNFRCCGITQNGESSCDLLLSVTNRKALCPPAPPPSSPPYKTFITLLPVTFSQLDPQLGVGCGKRLVLWYLLTDGLKLFNCQIFSRMAFGIKGCSSKTRFISSIIRLLCPALWHYVHDHIIYTVYSDCVLVFAFAFLSCKKKICFKQDFLHWIIQKLAKICQDFKE